MMKTVVKHVLVLSLILHCVQPGTCFGFNTKAGRKQLGAEYQFFIMVFTFLSNHLSDFAGINNQFLLLVDIELAKRGQENPPNPETFCIRGVPWNKLRSQWDGERSGYDAMLASLPGLLEQAAHISGNYTRRFVAQARTVYM